MPRILWNLIVILDEKIQNEMENMQNWNWIKKN